ncbi:Por secretion system C-terminal sorting domain-containing protein [Lutibacter agarilyticus]|uniref:Por secretion system C-terminal sorting domain-containing protein n=1 Tax=Lutibacter agarilyticus TaxID=1109740 RepID=A0A238VBI2_9FLAO|nr:right-handed parallel beta-helix repeat-containing protein [Lutibacter agarilyticus]SNR31538.1 Por secretion system C-terminal sorting domain-containing protein [Lutibacter agarilyticus]
MSNLKRIVLVPLLFIVLNSFSRNIYVAKDGDDSNPGTEESPYLTISKAASIAQPGDIVFIKEGTYEETLKPANSGTAGSPIIFQSYPGDKVIISAMEALSGWTQDTGSIYKTTIPFNSLEQHNFVMNGETALDLARWPNKTVGVSPFDLNTLRNTGGSDGSVISNAYLTESSIPSHDWTGGAVWFYGDKPGSGWISWKATITSSAGGRVNFNLNKNPDWIRTFHAPADFGDFFLEGVKSALDYQNEWWFNSSTKELFVQLPNGTAPIDGVVQMRRRIETINLKDKKYIEVRNLAVFGGSINLEDSSTWQTNNRTTNNVLYGISSFYGNHTQGIVSGFNANSPSVSVQGQNNTIEKCEIAYNAASGIQVRGNNHIIKDNRIHDFNFLGSYDAPVVMRGITNTKFSQNEVFNGGRDGVNYSGENNELAFNDISKSNLIADDCALFYTVGKQLGTKIHHNWFHDAASSGDKKKAAGIYLDNNAEGFSVHHNVVWNTEWSSIQINWNGKDIDIFNNTLWNGAQVMGAWHKDGTEFTNVKVWNNLGSDENWEPQSDKQNNLTVASSVFVDSNNGDFYLSDSSIPINAGKIIPGITDGYSGSMPDVGAYEYGNEKWVAGITWDYKYGPTGLGCYGLPGEDCITLPKNDQDKDGVADEIDECPDTPLGRTVNAVGCEFFSLPADNFKLLSTSESCPNSNNGSISIESSKELAFTAKITETNESKEFTKNITFENLDAGTYTVCITTTEDTNYKQCFTIKIKQPQALKVSTKVHKSTSQITLKLSGSKQYRIELNEKILITNENEITLDLISGKNNLKVKTELDCQGVYIDEFSLLNNITIYPTVVNNKFSIGIPSPEGKTINYQVISISGNIVINKTVKITNQPIIVNTSNLSKGLYFVNIIGLNYNVQSKIIKQ